MTVSEAGQPVMRRPVDLDDPVDGAGFAADLLARYPKAPLRAEAIEAELIACAKGLRVGPRDRSGGASPAERPPTPRYEASRRPTA